MDMNRLKKVTFLGIIFWLTFFSMLAFSADEICDKYFNENPEFVIQKLKANPTSEAQLCIGAMYYKGLGVKKDTYEAVKWVQKAAEQGHPVAQATLGVFYLKGEGIALDKGKAYEWFLKAALQDYARAQYYLGGLYYEGNGVERNIIEAIKWFKKASDKDYKEAQESLAQLETVIWKKDISGFKPMLLLVDKSGKTYPNEKHISGQLEKLNYLVVEKNNEFLALLTLNGCNKGKDGHCSETVDISIFKPDWSIAVGYKNVKPNNDKIFMSFKIDTDDPKGQYRIFAVIYEKNKTKTELSQIFWVQD